MEKKKFFLYWLNYTNESNDAYTEQNVRYFLLYSKFKLTNTQKCTKYPASHLNSLGNAWKHKFSSYFTLNKGFYVKTYIMGWT